MIRLRRRHGRAFVLAELIAALIVLAAVGAAFTWLTRAQFVVNDRLAKQAHRQSAMRAALNNLRVDMAEAKDLTMAVIESDDDEAGEHQLYELKLDTHSGLVRYELFVDRPVFNPEATTIAAPPPSFFSLVRIDASGSEKRWPLFALSPVIEPVKNSEGDVTGLAVSFSADDSANAELSLYRAYRTTLRLGGRS